MLNAHLRRAGSAAALVLISSSSFAQGTVTDYRRAMTLRERYQGLALNVTDQTRWVQNTSKLVYRKTVKGGHQFVVVDAETRAKAPAFDHARLAAALGTALGRTVAPLDLPFAQFSFVDGLSTIEFTITENGNAPPQAAAAPAPPWRCTLADYTCRATTPGAGRGRGGRGNGLAGPVRPTFDVNGAEPKKSPDGKLEALVNNFNIGIREVGSRAVTLLSTDGSEGSYYDPASIVWSPDSKRIAAYRIKPGFRRYVHYVESSPEDQLQPKHSTLQYAKPGDVLDVETPVIFHVEAKRQLVVDNALFPNPYDLSRLEWHKDGATVTFEYNQRGHQVYRVITIDADTGTARAVITEEAPTFFSYSGKRFRHDVDSGREVIWMSERDGWNHLYLYDGATGVLKNQITKGPWVVRGVVEVQDKARQIYFLASGMYPGKDPYFVHFYRINFDGTGLTALTPADANHTIALSPDAKFYVDTYSRVESAPATELRRSSDGSLVQEIERAEIDDLVKAGWTPPEVFVAPGRDGVTDIWGVIFRPSNFDPSKKYPVLENIYAGPQGAFVPKSFAAFNAMQAQAEIGFIVVQIDGMGTNHRSKAFHDVAWKNLKDAGFPDRVLWHKAVAAKYPYYDITRVGLYGTSAGGQSALGGLLFFPDFYKAAVASSGCHDNRMDKIWWNEQWMGWPIGPHYAESSNVENAHRLQGRVLLIVGEMDQNVDPASTYQVVNQLIAHKKDFELLVIPGAGHTNGGPYGEHKRFDFFTRHLLGATPPEWTTLEDVRKKETETNGASARRPSMGT